MDHVNYQPVLHHSNLIENLCFVCFVLFVKKKPGRIQECNAHGTIPCRVEENMHIVYAFGI